MENIKTFEKVIEELCEKIGHKNISWEKSYMIENINITFKIIKESEKSFSSEKRKETIYRTYINDNIETEVYVKQIFTVYEGNCHRDDSDSSFSLPCIVSLQPIYEWR